MKDSLKNLVEFSAKNGLNNLIVITLGDPGGISAEILVKSLKKCRFLDYDEDKILIFGSFDVIKDIQSTLNLNIKIKKISDFDFICNATNLDGLFSNYNILVYDPFYEQNTKIIKKYGLNGYKKYISLNKESFLSFVQKGKISKFNGFFAERYLYLALEFIKNIFDRFRISLLTLPVNKKAISFVKKGFIGHTEYISNYFKIRNVTMTMYSEEITIMLVTTHIPIFKLKKYINKTSFESTLKNSIHFYKMMGFNNGIGVLSLNPHASDKGLIGKEEKWIREIVCRYKKKYNESVNISGPIPSDTAFAKYGSKKYSIYIAFYHDQGMIPFKAFAKGKGTNITFGLPFLRISPDHGTAFDIVGKNIARIDSIDSCFNVIKRYNDLKSIRG